MIDQNSKNINEEGVIITEGGKNGVIQTSSGKLVPIMNPSPDDIDLEDIVHSLPKQCRFNGHCNAFYSVAEHCVRGHDLAMEWYGPDIAREFLLHDATEAYVGDCIRPVKRLIPFFEEIEQGFWKAISTKFGLPYIHSEEVHYLDNVMVVWEKRDLLPNSCHWPNLPDITSLKLPELQPWSSSYAQVQYKESLRTLFTGMFH